MSDRFLHATLLLLLLPLASCDAESEPPPEDVIAIDGDPNGLWWDDSSDELLVADDNGNRLLAWDGTATRVVADLPASTADSPGLGQLVRTSDGSIVVTRFGFGTAGDVVVVAPDGSSSVVAGLDPERRRIGLTVADDGTLYSAWFVKVGEEQVGAIGRLDLSGTETAIVDGLGKAVGVLALGDALYVTVQNENEIIRVDPTTGDVEGFVSGFEAPDLLAPGPEGSIFAGSSDGSVSKVTPDGSFARVASGLQQVRGVAWDGGRRLFVADHDPDESDGISHTIRIFDLEGT